MTGSPRCLCLHHFRQARADQVERIIGTSYGGELSRSEVEIRRIEMLDGLTRSALETATTVLAAAGRVEFDPESRPLVVRLMAEADA